MTREELNRKGKALAAAYERCKALEAAYLPQLRPAWPYAWDFNLLYDLRYRIEDRINDHNIEVNQYLWANRGYVIHTLA